MLELSFEKEVVKTLTTGSNQWVERKDLYGATPDQLWANFRDKLNNNNYAKLQGHPLTDTEFNQVKRAIEVRTSYEAAKLLDQQQRLALQDKQLLEEYKAEIKDLKALTMAPYDDGEKEVTSDKQPEPENSTPESQPKPKKWWRFGK